MIEILIVTGVMVIIIVLAGSISSRFAARRSMDNMTRNLSSTLQLAKLNAVRQGVEYRTVLASCTQLNNADPDCLVCNTYDDYNAGDDSITVTIERGDSNRGSTNWCVESTQTRRVQQIMSLDLAGIPETNPLRFNFNPNGTLVDQTGAILAQEINIGVEPAATAKIKRCGRVTVTPLGRIGIVEGNWDQGASECQPITN